MDTTTYETPDGALRFKVVRDEGDVTLGFEGFPWHTHAELLVGTYGASEEGAPEAFIRDLLEGRSIIAICRRGTAITDVRIADDTDEAAARDGETIEFRRWDGTAA